MEIKDLTFSYDKQKRLLHKITAHIPKGKITTIIGPNGSGKSTLLQLLTNNLKTQAGQIIIEGHALQQLKQKQLAQMLSVVHQHNMAPEDMTVESLVYYGRLPYKKAFTSYKEEDEEIVDWAIEAVGLSNWKKKLLHTLSGGQQQRAWLAMAIAQKTPYMFLDEPTSALDIYYQYDILQLVNRLNKKEQLTTVMVLHDMNQALQFSDYIIAMKDGELVTFGPPEEVMTEAYIKEIYGIDVILHEDDRVGKFIVPLKQM
ncbi:MAG TPA: ABC transporter ATP-binding protein [Pseudogracilibacillus sp.]|nr:ABC transporter ATP-binding protein [Pseudogracilibacillus sp.]